MYNFPLLYRMHMIRTAACNTTALFCSTYSSTFYESRQETWIVVVPGLYRYAGREDVN